MTENGRKGSSSKWDLKEGPRLLPREHNDDRKRRPGNKERQPRRRYGEENYKEARESLDATGAWDGEPTYGTRMSPGLDDWRKQRHNRSPKSGRGRSYRSRSRSRSRSPERGFKRTGSYDRGIGPQSYPHQDYKDYEDRRYSGSGQTDSWEGRHRRINNTSKYYNPDDSRERPLMTGRSNDFSKRSANDFSREREIDRRDNRVASFDHNRNHEHRRSGGIIPCKFFAAGNCRNGNFCRFSHHGQTRDSSDNGGRNDWEQPINNRIDNMDPPREGSRWRGTHVPKWNEARNGGHEFPEQMEIPRSEDDRFMVHQMDSDIAIEESSDREYTKLTAEITDNHVGDMELELSPAHNYRLPSPGHIVGEEPGHVFEPSKFLIQDEVSSQPCQQDIHREVNHKHQTVEVMQPFISQTQYFQQGPSLEKDAVNGFSCENGNAIGGSTMPHSDLRFSAHIPENKNEIDLNFSSHVPAREGFDQNGQTSSQLLSVLNKNQQIYESFSYTGGIQQPSREGQSSNPPVVDNVTTSEVISDDPSNQNTVSNEQLSNLTVSLARFLESGKQLPELYAALNVPNSMGFIQSSISSSTGPTAFPTPVSNQSQQVSAIGLQKQYDTASDSMELIKPGINKLPDEVAPNLSENKIFLDEKSDIPSLPSGVDPNIKIQQSSREDPNDSCKDEENNTPEVGERNKGKDNGTLEKTKGDGKADENKKSNDAKNLRAFKFALAEFVKEVLKPKWKEGQINKESHKTIVKKVVDKVTGSTQGVHIPQSQEKIDSYLSSNKPKLSKLVQAYVEKIQKEKPAVT